MDQIRDLKGYSIIMAPIKSPEMFGMDKPALVVTMLAKHARELGQLKLSKIEVKKAAPEGAETPPSPRAQAEYYAASNSSGALFSTDDFLFSQLNKTADDFLAKASAIPTATPKK